MRKLLLGVVLGVLTSGCGNAADTLRGGTWKVDKWTYSIDSVFDGHANMPATKSTSTASASNAGTLSFTGGQEVSAGSGQLTRSLTQFAARGTDTASFTAGTFNSLLTWDPKGFQSEEDMVTIYDGNDPTWNGPWTLTGGGTDVTLTRSYQTDFSPTQHMIEHHSLHLKR
jgi:hypothetical protein